MSPNDAINPTHFASHVLSRRRICIVTGCLSFLLSVFIWIRCWPLPEHFLDPEPHRSLLLTDRHGIPLYESLSEKETRSRWLPANALPENLVQATLAAEDRRFFHHVGIDPPALARAAWINLRSLRIVEGGSTITQQVVKHLMSRSHTIGGKLKEMLYALRLEHRLSKKEILALYLNLAPYGNQYAGAQAASLGYFGCPTSHLTPAQSSLLAALPQRPSALDPYTHLQSALRRQRWVLNRMKDLDMINEVAYERACFERLSIKDPRHTFEAPHFVEHVLATLPLKMAQEVRTTLDLDLQRDVQGILNSHRRFLLSKDIHNMAVIVLENDTGDILAWEGSGDYFDSEHGGTIDGVTTPRQPGSALKPFTYALAFEHGMTPATVLPDIPSHFPTAEEGVLYSPRNYDGVYRGPMRARKALAGSENVPAVWTLSKVGVPHLLDFLRRIGFTTFDRTADYYGFGLTLGDAEVRLDEMVAAYACMARGGLAKKPRLIMDSDADSGRRLFSERAAFWITDILSDVEARAYAFGRGGSLEFPFQVAAKTGTSQGYTDNWTIGYTKDITVGVWVGNFDRTPLRSSSGVTGAGPIFHDVLVCAQKRVTGRLPTELDPSIVSVPEELRRISICALSGMKAGTACPSVVEEWLESDQLPPICSWHTQTDAQTMTVWPPEYQNWAKGHGLSTAQFRSTTLRQPGKQKPAIIIENPPDGTTYLIDPTLRMEYQSLELQAICGDMQSNIIWKIDGEVIGSSSADRPLFWPLRRGKHILEAIDTLKQRSSVTFLVK